MERTEVNVSESRGGESDTWQDRIRSLARQNKLAAFSAVLILLIILIAIFAPLIAPYDHLAQNLAQRLQHPSAAHLLGTDELGRDVLSRLIFGARISLTIGLVPTLISMMIGTALGMCAGFYGGKVDFIIMRMADVMLAFPSLLLAMVVMYTMGGGLINIFIALSLVNWAGTARIVRSQTLSLKEKEYVEAARSIGVKNSVIMLRHILPNCLPSLIVLFTLDIPSAILGGILKLSRRWRAAAQRKLGSDGGARKEIPLLRAVAVHRAQRGDYDRGACIQLFGRRPARCYGPVLKRAVRRNYDRIRCFRH